MKFSDDKLNVLHLGRSQSEIEDWRRTRNTQRLSTLRISIMSFLKLAHSPTSLSSNRARYRSPLRKSEDFPQGRRREPFHRSGSTRFRKPRNYDSPSSLAVLRDLPLNRTYTVAIRSISRDSLADNEARSKFIDLPD